MVTALSCSEDRGDKTNPNASEQLRLTNTELVDLQTEYSHILASEEYERYLINIKAMVVSINGVADAPLDNRLHFNDWITINLSLTEFNSVSAAMIAFDEFDDSSSISRENTIHFTIRWRV